MDSGGKKHDMLFVLSVDTEEEWDWSQPLAERKASLINTNYLQEFHFFCSKRGIRPTYFFDYVAANNGAVTAAIAPFLLQGSCEVGARLNPWSTPPEVEAPSERNSHLINLPLEQAEEKLAALIEAFEVAFRHRPKAFRTGRWGTSGALLEMLSRHGISVDSSMYPLYSDEWIDCEDTPSTPYWPDTESPARPGAQRNIIEIPVTAGFNRVNQDKARALYRRLSRGLAAKLHLVGVAWQTKFLRRLYLSPELHSAEEMSALVDSAIRNRQPILHMFLHSSSLLDNGKGMMNSAHALETIQQRIDQLLEHTEQRANLQFCTISEAAALVTQRSALA